MWPFRFFHQDGASISVLDSESNKIRHCSSLSGGEEFLASISLALGLADAIQCQHSNAIIESYSKIKVIHSILINL